MYRFVLESGTVTDELGYVWFRAYVDLDLTLTGAAWIKLTIRNTSDVQMRFSGDLDADRASDHTFSQEVHLSNEQYVLTVVHLAQSWNQNSSTRFLIRRNDQSFFDATHSSSSRVDTATGTTITDTTTVTTVKTSTPIVAPSMDGLIVENLAINPE